MFRKRETLPPAEEQPAPIERITSVLGSGTIWKGSLGGSGGVRIEGTFEGEIALRGVLVVGETGRVTCEQLRANLVIVAGAVRGDIIAQKLEIRATGRVWGNVTTAAFATEEGAFLRGQIQMEDRVEIDLSSSSASLAAGGETAPIASSTEDTVPVSKVLPETPSLLTPSPDSGLPNYVPPVPGPPVPGARVGTPKPNGTPEGTPVGTPEGTPVGTPEDKPVGTPLQSESHSHT